MIAQEQVSLLGTVDRVTYYNNDNGYAVLRITEGGDIGVPHTVTGTVFNVAKGETIKCHGQWLNHEKYGLQFKANLIQSNPPNNIESIKKYLSSGIFKGVGMKHAETLVDTFGEAVFDVIEKTPKLLHVKAKLSKKLCDAICEDWSQQKINKDIILFLNSYGISANRANSIYEVYGDNTIKLVSENPYCLARDIKGIGFTFCDDLAMKLGIKKESVFRIAAGISHVLLQATFYGNCGLPQGLLIAKSKELLDVDVELIKDVLYKQIDKRELVRDGISDTKDLILLEKFYECENKIADLMRSMQSTGVSWSRIEAGRAIESTQKKLNIELKGAQRDAITNAVNTKIMVITGGPGTGKTTLINAIIDALSNSGDKLSIKLCAPTGRAAKRMTEAIGMEAQTIHRMLKAKPTGVFAHNEENKLKCDYVIVDESSMMDVQLFCSLLRAIPDSSGLLLVGDIDQLPSVGPGSVLSDIINSQTVITYRLDKVHRQKEDSNIVLSAHAVNKGIMPRIHYETNEATDFRFIESTPDELSNKLINSIEEMVPNHYNIKKDVQVLAPIRKGGSGTIELNKILQKTLNLNKDNKRPFVEKNGEKYFEGDKVMQTENNYDKHVFNGDVGTVVSIDADKRILGIEFDDDVILYDYCELDQIILAYAITIHKSQGSEYPVVIIPLTMQSYIMLQRNLIYTGITRGKKLVIIVGQQNALARAVENNQIAKRYTRLKELLIKQENSSVF